MCSLSCLPILRKPVEKILHRKNGGLAVKRLRKITMDEPYLLDTNICIAKHNSVSARTLRSTFGK